MQASLGWARRGPRPPQAVNPTRQVQVNANLKLLNTLPLRQIIICLWMPWTNIILESPWIFFFFLSTCSRVMHLRALLPQHFGNESAADDSFCLFVFFNYLPRLLGLPSNQTIILSRWTWTWTWWWWRKPKPRPKPKRRSSPRRLLQSRMWTLSTPLWWMNCQMPSRHGIQRGRRDRCSWIHAAKHFASQESCCRPNWDLSQMISSSNCSSSVSASRTPFLIWRGRLHKVEGIIWGWFFGLSMSTQRKTCRLCPERALPRHVNEHMCLATVILSKRASSVKQPGTLELTGLLIALSLFQFFPCEHRSEARWWESSIFRGEFFSLGRF